MRTERTPVDQLTDAGLLDPSTLSEQDKQRLNSLSSQDLETLLKLKRTFEDFEISTRAIRPSF